MNFETKTQQIPFALTATIAAAIPFVSIVLTGLLGL